ncbi:Btb poz domain containing protein [Lasiodiplodia theobromae]|uniref:Btb poz domain containing protein n=1 Tax=Lasiodiplodia theobromae TaxID=45133 RepID=UPI0015C37188|nr:Btb poz domain containing protein [Lasiodiplodia theobromae]KAF4544316.1 Btb poz domain containing protein [Lasiodiplodia theobromae]
MSSPVKMKTIHSAARNTKPCACTLPYSELPDYTTWGALTTLLVGGGGCGPADDASSSSPPTPLVVHTGVLTHASPVFRAAFATNPSTGLPIWREGATLTYALPEENPDAIAVCLSWLYTRRLWPRSGDPDRVPDHLVPLDWETLVGAAIFAAVYEMHGLHNAVVSAIVDAVVQRWGDGDRPTHLIAEVYESVPAGMPLRTLFLHVGLLEDREWLLAQGHGDDKLLPEEFWADVAKYDKLLPYLRLNKECERKWEHEKMEEYHKPVAADINALTTIGKGCGGYYYYRDMPNAYPQPAAGESGKKALGVLALLETRRDWELLFVCDYLHVLNEGPEEHVRRKKKEKEELDAYSMRLSNVAPPKHDIVIEGEYDDNGLRRLVGIWQHVRNLRARNP